MALYRKILVPIDFSPVSLEALAVARDMAQSSGSSLHLFHAADDVAARYLGYPFDALGQLQTSVMESARDQLRELAREECEGLQVEQTMVVSSSPASAIVKFAGEHGFDLIVMGTHGRGAVLRMMLGSVAERVVRTAPCPVLVVRDRSTRFHAHAQPNEAGEIGLAGAGPRH